MSWRFIGTESKESIAIKNCDARHDRGDGSGDGAIFCYGFGLEGGHGGDGEGCTGFGHLTSLGDGNGYGYGNALGNNGSNLHNYSTSDDGNGGSAG